MMFNVQEESNVISMNFKMYYRVGYWLESNKEFRQLLYCRIFCSINNRKEELKDK